MGCAEGHSPFAGSLRVSLRYKFFPLSAQACPEPAEGKGVRGSWRGVFNTLLDEPTTRASLFNSSGWRAATVQKSLWVLWREHGVHA